MSEVNLDRLRDLAGHLRDACRQLREISTQDIEQFMSDARTINSTKYLLIVATEAALDSFWTANGSIFFCRAPM